MDRTDVVAGVTFACLAALAVGLVLHTRTEVQDRRSANERLRAELEDEQQVAARLEATQARLEALHRARGEMTRILPAQEVLSEELVLELIQRGSERSGTQLRAITVVKDKRSPGRRVEERPPWDVLRVRVDVDGSYPQLLGFMHSLESRVNLVRVEDFSLLIGPRGREEQMSGKLQLAFFRYRPGAASN